MMTQVERQEIAIASVDIMAAGMIWYSKYK
jgi:hypothetical protein